MSRRIVIALPDAPQVSLVRWKVGPIPEKTSGFGWFGLRSLLVERGA